MLRIESLRQTPDGYYMLPRHRQADPSVLKGNDMIFRRKALIGVLFVLVSAGLLFSGYLSGESLRACLLRFDSHHFSYWKDAD